MLSNMIRTGVINQRTVQEAALGRDSVFDYQKISTLARAGGPVTSVKVYIFWFCWLHRNRLLRFFGSPTVHQKDGPGRRKTLSNCGQQLTQPAIRNEPAAGA